MTAQSKATLKGKFETGDTPTGSDYADLIDSALNTADTTAQTLSSDLTVPVLTATTVTANAVNASSATLTNLDVTNFAVTNLSAVTVTAGTVQADNVTVVSAVSAKDMWTTSLTSTDINSTNVSAGQLWVGGTQIKQEAFCMIYAVASADTTFSAASGWQRLLATTSAAPGLAVNVTQATTNGFMFSMDVNTSAVYHCDFGVSMLAGGNSKVYQFGFAKNGTPIPQGRMTRKIGTGADVGAATLVTSVVLTSGDTIEVVVRNLTDTTTLTLVDGTFNVSVV